MDAAYATLTANPTYFPRWFAPDPVKVFHFRSLPFDMAQIRWRFMVLLSLAKSTARGRLKEYTTLSPSLPGESVMPKGVASSNHLAMMKKALGAYCSTYNITDSADREDAATTILHLFDSGFRDEEALLAEVIKHRSPTAFYSKDVPHEPMTTSQSRADRRAG